MKIVPYIKTLLSLSVLLASSFILYGQRTITGQVTDATDGTALIGATIIIKGTTVGTVTDLEGNYSLNISSPEDILSFQYMGYETYEVTAGDQVVINVTLQPSIEEIEEIVVTGYGTVRKNDLTGAIAVVSSDDLEKSNNTSLSQALQGKAAGVYITTNSGDPGSGVSIRIRGVGSINRNAQPLVVIDWIPGGGSINDLHPEDIESISILKDASATAIYGADGSNGVLLIQTKRGSVTTPQIHLRTKTGMAFVPKKMDILNADEYVDFYTKTYDYYNSTHIVQKDFPQAYTAERRAEFGNISTDWQDLIAVSPAWSQDYHLSVSGGNENANYRVSGNFVDEDGTLITTWRKLYSLKANSNFNVGKKIRIGETFTFTSSNGRNEASQQGNPWITAAIASPLMPVYNDTRKGGYEGPDDYITGPNERTNTVAELRLNENTYRSNSFYSSLFGEWDFIKGFTFKTTLGLIYSSDRSNSFSPTYQLGPTWGQRSNATSRLSESSGDYRKFVWDNQLTYSNTFGRHNVTATAVHSMQDAFSNWFQGATANLQYEDLRILGMGDPEAANVSQWKTPDRFESYLGRLIYDFAGKYYATASFRRDGSSRFGKRNRWGNFPSFSLAWKINEDFLQQIEQLNMLKLRVGWGQTGNADIGTFVYDATISTAMEHVYTLGREPAAIFGAAPFYNIPSPDVKWEASTMINVGTDIAMFNNRLQFSGEYYYKRQDELLVQLPLPIISGMSGDATPPWVNLGEIHNTGVEFNTSWKKMTGTFTYEVTGNLTTIKNVVDYLPAGDIIQDNNTAFIGHSIGALYGYVAERILQVEDFVTDDDGNPVQNTEDGSYTLLYPEQQDLTAPGDLKFRDLNKDGNINDLDRTLIGKVIPDFTYGLTFTCGYKGLDFSVFLNGVQNVDVYNYYRSQAGIASGDFHTKDENKLREVLDYWTPENRSNKQTRLSLTDENNNGEWFSSWWVEDASYLRIRDIQIGYSLPAKLINIIGISNLRLYAAAVNLLTLTKYTGYDPEIASSNPLSTNIDYGHYPVPRTIYLGITADF